MNATKCIRCHGAGRVNGFSHIKNGTCFRCGGTGTERLTEAQVAWIGRQQKAEAAAQKAQIGGRLTELDTRTAALGTKFGLLAHLYTEVTARRVDPRTLPAPVRTAYYVTETALTSDEMWGHADADDDTDYLFTDWAEYVADNNLDPHAVRAYVTAW